MLSICYTDCTDQADECMGGCCHLESNLLNDIISPHSACAEIGMVSVAHLGAEICGNAGVSS